ncbi:MAG: 3-hydroxyacyl-CoA dehydrogenase family protein [Deltaproteobacteria bacterium]|nr:3-hydroxyacyl-CoA dehydrogenase family protein [Deltaproteobacteria bacterium]MBW2594950.1 3-hydroxyacyl-CoA dehydrogenase family protein [Deltaproteobacteria bacterium]MBW2649718.1 3-hydroxyacyl-CoA dehydrogenase family protein [Deltaproteobacteria bacterium]
MKEITKIGIIGAGLMGHGIAQIFASHGYSINIFDSVGETLAAVPGKIRSNFKVFLELGLVSETDVEECLKKITLSDNLEALSEGAHVIIEAVSENLDLKRKIFSELEQYVPQDAILCSNTSAISITEISEGLKHKARFLGTHFWNPPHIIPCVEIVKGKYTSDTVFETIFELMKNVNKEPVRVLKDIPGFLGNRLQHAMWREAISMVEKGVAEAEDIDKVVKYGFGLRCPFIGPLETADLAGIDLDYAVHEYLFPYLENSSEPSPLLKEKIGAGMLGVKTGQGFHAWTPEKVEKIINQRDLILLKIKSEINQAINDK